MESNDFSIGHLLKIWKTCKKLILNGFNVFDAKVRNRRVFLKIQLLLHSAGRDHPQKDIKTYRKSILCDAGGAAVLIFRKNHEK